MLFTVTLLVMLRRESSELLVISFRAARKRLKAFGEMSLFAGSAIVELRHHVNIIVALDRSIVSKFLFFDLNKCGTRSLREYFLILILLLIHYSILVMDGVLVIPILLLRQYIVFEGVHTLGAASQGASSVLFECIPIQLPQS